ncbi:MAG: bifunctional folylpolyglutamate synthase/dihydrofolate synthase [Phycisphaerales bacterium]|nr:bifunctional folylpolyglutamate synthase/dihydrofolate synthase [Planctomycetota bacterium]MBL6996990.1 bifunctional folylpolyglutamate synthase/dihydrofolate synthase [Phycisphaerales bacterium]
MATSKTTTKKNTVKRTTKKAATKQSSGKKTSIDTFSAAVSYLLNQTDYERMRVVQYDESTFKLDSMKSLLNAIGNPQDKVAMIHVAGTVGKGSTVAMITSMLQGNGYAVGAYTSPHLIDIRERIVVNSEMVSEESFTELLKIVVDAATKNKLTPTFFELITAVAFKHFADEAVDIAVIETGLGGRLDSTNVITPLMTLITKIDLDHTNILGDTVEEIAREKAGIFKPSVPAISAHQNEEVTSVLKTCAESTGTEVSVIAQDIEFSARFGGGADGKQHTRICVITEDAQYMHIPVPLDGEHQATNCALAISAINQLKKFGYKFNNIDIYDSLAKTRISGRMEVAWERPKIIVDGAHNPTALQTLIKSVGAHVPYDSMVCVFGCCQDKDVTGMLERISLGADKIIFTKAQGNPRAAEPHILQKQFAKISGKMTQVAETLPEALEIAAQAASREDLICVTGSFYLVGETKSHLSKLAAKK